MILEIGTYFKVIQGRLTIKKLGNFSKKINFLKSDNVPFGLVNFFMLEVETMESEPPFRKWPNFLQLKVLTFHSFSGLTPY